MNTTKLKPCFAGARVAILCLVAILLSLPGYAWAADQEDSALLWSIYRDGQAAGYILGTIHSEDPRVLDFSEAFSELLTENTIFAMEIVPDLPTLQQLNGLMQYQDGTTLESRIGAERYARLQSVLAGYHVPPDWMARMKIWAAMMTLSVPPPETGFFMDFSLSLRAAGAGLKVVGLETLQQQLDFLENMPVEQQLILLDQAMAEHDKVDQLHEQMVTAYLQDDLQALTAQAGDQLADVGEEVRQYFMHQGIEMRNQGMIDALLPLFAQDRVFVAVGALHLPGETGLIGLLRDRGYELRPLPLPFNAAIPVSAPVAPRQQKN